MPVGDGGQALELELAVVAKLALENASGSGTAQSLVRFIDLRQQLDIRTRIASGKTTAVTGFDPPPAPWPGNGPPNASVAPGSAPSSCPGTVGAIRALAVPAHVLLLA